MAITRSQRPRTPSPPPDSRGKKGNGEYPTPARARVFQLRGMGHTAKQVEEETGIPVRTQGYWLRSNSERRTGKFRPGRQSKISGDVVDRIIKSLEGRYSIHRLDYKTQIKRNNLNVYVDTLKKALHERGLRKYRAVHQHRLVFAKKYIKWPTWKWKYVRFSDESHFHHNSRIADWVLHRRGERFQPDTIQKKFKVDANEFHVWTCIGWNFKSKLVFYDLEEGEPRNVTQELYVKKMLPIVKGYRDDAEAKGQGFIFQEDNDSGHDTRSEENSARLYKDQINLDYIDDWPGFNPDLSPIENV